MSDFNFAVKYVLSNESGFVCNPNDPGGTTNFGITKSAYSDYKGFKVDDLDMKMITKDQAFEFYKKQIWDRYRFDEINRTPVATAIFDMFVNLGPAHAAECVQEAIGLPVDYVMGSETIAEINNQVPDQFIFRFFHFVKARYENIVLQNPSLKIFLKGWYNRADKLLSLAA